MSQELQDLFLDREVKKYESPVKSREFIMAHLAKRQSPAKRNELAQELKISGKHQLEGLKRRLRAMERDGQLIFNRRYGYTLPQGIELLQGTIIGHRDGFGFLRVNGDTDDYYLSIEQMKMVVHGDLVMAQVQNSNRKKRKDVRIVQVLIPKITHIVGRIFISAGKYFMVPNDSRIAFDIMIPQEHLLGANIGLMVVVKLIQRPSKYYKSIGKVVEILGDNMNTAMAVDIALRTYDIPHIWIPEVENNLSSFPKGVSEEDKFGRVDLRSLPLVTIDGEESSDFDDAVYCEKEQKGGWKLWVAIADVSYYVRVHSPLDEAARARATSIYFPSQLVIPMLPEVLSKGLCSLHPHLDRLCMVCEMSISSKGKLSSYKFYEAVIKSRARLTYNQVWQILQGDKEIHHSHSKQLIKNLFQLHDMYQMLEQARIERGGLSFEISEAKFILNPDRRIHSIELVKRNDAYKIIEECMILANSAAASLVEKKKEPALYRVHDQPNNDQIASLRSILYERGLTLNGKDNPNSKDYSNIMMQFTDRSDSDMLQTILRRSMKQAIYDPENRGHFGLALPAYAHFTSPIRRYPDLLLHRSIKYHLSYQKNEVYGRATKNGGWHYEIDEMLQLGTHCSINERRADEAVRDVSDWLKCDFMKNHIGDEFTGIITNVTSFGFFVRISQLLVDGLVHILSLNNDKYRYNNATQSLVGEHHGQVYQLGDKVNICVEAVHMDEKKIAFALVPKY